MDISFYHILSYYFIYSFLGWCLEVAFCSIKTGSFVNRGFLNGPVCPIYGFGSVIVILLLTPLANNLLLLFVGSVILTSLLELATGYFLKLIFHTQWWDYSKQKYNIGGYICLRFSLAWGLACLFLMKVLHPLLAKLVDIFPTFLGYILLIIFSVTMLIDLIVTVSAIMKLNRDLGEISKLTASLHKGSETLAENIGNQAILVAEKVNALNLEEKKEFLAKQMEEGKAKVSKVVVEGRNMVEHISTKETSGIKLQLNKLLEEKQIVRERLLKAFPNMISFKYDEALKTLKNKRKKNSDSINNNMSDNSNDL